MAINLSVTALHDLARGAALLGAGGGGDPYLGRLLVEQQLKAGKRIRIVDVDTFADDALILPVALLGAPTVIVEKLPDGEGNVRALRSLEERLGVSAAAVMPVECGGLNSMAPLLVGALTGLPVVDADGMGRAFPEMQMETFHVNGVSGSPAALASDHGEVAVVAAADNRRLEAFARVIAVEMGGSSYLSCFAMDAATVRRTAVPRTLSLALLLGRTIRQARTAHDDPFAALAAAIRETPYQFGAPLLRGKVIDVARRTTGGFARGSVTVESENRRQLLIIDFQNEHLVARLDGETRAVVPDLICTLDSETAEPITTEALRYGQRITVFVLATPDVLRTEQALATFGPAAFGLDDPYRPVEELVANASQ